MRMRIEALKTELYTRDPPCVQMSKLHGAIERAAKQVDAKKEALAKATAALAGAEDHYRDLLDRRRALAAREEEQDFYEENEYDMETDHVGQWWRADKLGNSWQESWGQSYWKEDDRASPDLMQPSLEIDMLKSVIAEAQQTQHAFQQSIMAENAKFQQNVASMLGKRALGRCPASSFHSCGYGGAIYDLTVQQIALQDQSAASQATVGDLRLALGMKHPHDVIDQMDLDLAMSGVFRAVPLLPDSEKLGRIQVFTDGSAMLERAWPHRRTSAAWEAVLVQTNSQGLDALIGFLGDTVQTHQQHPQYLGARVKTISTAELSAIITTLATVLRACSKPPELDFLSDSVFSIKVLQRQCRASSNVELIQCGRALVDQTRRITQVTFQHVKAHSGLLFNEMADRVADAARKRVRIGATAPCLRPSVAGQGQEQKRLLDHHLTHSISSEQVCFLVGCCTVH